MYKLNPDRKTKETPDAEVWYIIGHREKWAANIGPNKNKPPEAWRIQLQQGIPL
jgi:hypothetical protein